MSIDKEKNVLNIRDPRGTIEVRPHPEEVIDVDPQILAIMESRLSGKSFAGIYGDEDKVSNELLVRREIEKLKRVFGDASQVSARFTSIAAIKDVKEDLKFEEINYGFLSSYALKKSDGAFVDECDLYFSLLNNYDLRSKAQRLDSSMAAPSDDSESLHLLKALSGQYLSSNIDPLQITKEVIQLEPFVLKMVREERVVSALNNLLKVFYGGLA